MNKLRTASTTHIESDWQVGLPITFRRFGDVTDERPLLEYDKPRRLQYAFHPVLGEFKDEPPSRVTIEHMTLAKVTNLAKRAGL